MQKQKSKGKGQPTEGEETADEAAEPGLHSRDSGADDGGQLHRDREGAGGPAARRRRRPREARAGREEGRADRVHRL